MEANLSSNVQVIFFNLIIPYEMQKCSEVEINCEQKIPLIICQKISGILLCGS
jgi:hypothetical protein